MGREVYLLLDDNATYTQALSCTSSLLPIIQNVINKKLSIVSSHSITLVAMIAQSITLMAISVANIIILLKQPLKVLLSIASTSSNLIRSTSNIKNVFAGHIVSFLQTNTAVTKMIVIYKQTIGRFFTKIGGKY